MNTLAQSATGGAQTSSQKIKAKQATKRAKKALPVETIHGETLAENLFDAMHSSGALPLTKEETDLGRQTSLLQSPSVRNIQCSFVPSILIATCGNGCSQQNGC